MISMHSVSEGLEHDAHRPEPTKTFQIIHLSTLDLYMRLWKSKAIRWATAVRHILIGDRKLRLVPRTVRIHLHGVYRTGGSAAGL